MVGFWNLVGTGIAPVSKETAVKEKLIFVSREAARIFQEFLSEKADDHRLLDL